MSNMTASFVMVIDSDVVVLVASVVMFLSEALNLKYHILLPVIGSVLGAAASSLHCLTRHMRSYLPLYLLLQDKSSTTKKSLSVLSIPNT